MHHVVLEQWSRGTSPIHARDPRVKILALAAFLVILATTPPAARLAGAGYGGLLVFTVLLARLPLASVLLRAGVVLPFSVVFAAMTFLSGEAGRAFSLLQKSYLSALAVLVVAGATPVNDLLRGLESLGAPRFLLLVVHFLYRYLFVISEQAQHMRLAAACRAPSSIRVRFRRASLRAAAGAVAVLFARSYDRAEGIHRAMLARLFRGHFSRLTSFSFSWRDAVFLLFAVSGTVGVRLAFGVVR